MHQGPNRPDNLPIIETWDRYVDDCLSITEGEEEDIEELFKYINKLNPPIQFEYEVSKSSVDFLDLTIHLNPQKSKLEFELFIKPTSKGIFLNYESHHTKSVIINSAKNEFRRAILYGSTEELKENGVKKIESMLKNNSFPDTVISKALRECRTSLKQSINSTQTATQHNKVTYLCLPYISE